MPNPFRRTLPATLPVLLLLLAAVAIHPVAETGMNDDFSYIHTALTLARTGRVVYVGWASAMIGWQLALGAVFARVFGFSFTAVRLSNLLVAAVTAAVLQRTYCRLGLREGYSTVGTLLAMFSPLALASTFSFMTDIGGVCSIVLCLYCCLRAVAATRTRSCLLWLGAAALGNDVGGTVRQIVWLGVLVMVPCTVWLLRGRRGVLLVAAALATGSAAFLLGCMHWLNRQPYTLPETLVFGRVDGTLVLHLLERFVRMGLDFGLLLLPILLPLLVLLPWRRRGLRLVAGTATVCVGLGAAVLLHFHRLGPVLPPFLGNEVTVHGVIDVSELHSERPMVLGNPVRLLLLLLTLGGLFGLGAFCRLRPRGLPSEQEGGGRVPSARDLLVLLGPFLLAYFALLIPRGAYFAIFDRYLLIPFALLVPVVLRMAQASSSPRFLRTALALVAVYGLYGVAATHDVFSMYRARLRAVGELRERGVARTAIDGGFDYNGWTEIEEVGYLDSPEMVLPRGAYVPHPHLPPGTPCRPQMGFLTPHVQPRYGLAYAAGACDGPAGLPPVRYSDWLSLRPQFVYVVRLPPDASEPPAGQASSASSPASSSTGTPRDSAFSSLEPASSPATR